MRRWAIELSNDCNWLVTPAVTFEEIDAIQALARLSIFAEAEGVEGG